MMLETDAPPTPSIHCTMCDGDKPPNEFYASGRSSETGQCKVCIRGRTNKRAARRKAEGLPTRAKTRGKTQRPLILNPEKLMEAMGGNEPDLRLELAEKVLQMQQRTIELLVARSK